MKPLLWLFQFVLGCHHSQMSRVFTIKKRTYQVCCGCGQEFEYSWTLMHPNRSSVVDRPYASLNSIRMRR
jgi:hypothetical protein